MELDYKRIVVTFLMHLGDVILTTPFFEVLRKAAPHSHITYVIDEKLQQVMQYNPNIDELIVVDKKGRHNSISGLNEIAREINKKGNLISLLIYIPMNAHLIWHGKFMPLLQRG